jgi:hypothetical protein
MTTLDSKSLSMATGGHKGAPSPKKAPAIKFSKKKGVVPAIADGDFGAPASSFIPITGD